MNDDDLSLKFLAYPPPISNNLFAYLEKGTLERSGEHLKGSQTGLILYQTIDIAQGIYDGRLPLRLPPGLIGCPVLFLAGSSTGSLEPNVPYRVVGTLFNIEIAPHN
jgi:hypothetical protein